jgi:hypothetical protein
MDKNDSDRTVAMVFRRFFAKLSVSSSTFPDNRDLQRFIMTSYRSRRDSGSLLNLP